MICMEPKPGSIATRLLYALDNCGWIVGTDGVTKITVQPLHRFDKVQVVEIWKGDELIAKHMMGPGTTIGYKKVEASDAE